MDYKNLLCTHRTMTEIKTYNRLLTIVIVLLSGNHFERVTMHARPTCNHLQITNNACWTK